MESESKDQLLSQKLSSLKEEIKNNKYVLHNIWYAYVTNSNERPNS